MVRGDYSRGTHRARPCKEFLGRRMSAPKTDLNLLNSNLSLSGVGCGMCPKTRRRPLLHEKTLLFLCKGNKFEFLNKRKCIILYKNNIILYIVKRKRLWYNFNTVWFILEKYPKKRSRLSYGF